MGYGFSAGEVFQMAIDIEENGRLFYERARDMVDDAAAKEVFAQLGRDELEHKRRFAQLKSELPASEASAQVWDPEEELGQYLQMMADMHVFRSDMDLDATMGRIATAVEALRLAIQFEKDSVIFFLGMQDAARSKKAQEMIGQLVEEEKSHIRKLAAALRRHTSS